MPALQEYDIVEILTDPEFRKLPEPEQMKVMAEVDPEYAALAPEEQKKVLQDPEFQSESIKAEPPLTPEQVPGELDRLAAGRFAPTPPLPEFVTRPIDVPMPAVEPFTGPQPGPEPTPPEGPPLQIPEISPVAPGIGKLALQGAASGLGPVGAMGAVLRPDLTRLPEMVKKGAENVAAVLAENAKMGIMPGTAIPPALPADTAVGTEGYQAQAEKAAETYQAPVLPISELTPEPGLSRGIAQGIEGLTSPLNLSIAGALGGAGQAVRTVPSAARGIYNLLDTALAGYFAGAMAEGATEEVKAAYQAWQDGDYPAVAQHFGTATVEGLFAVAGATRVKKSVTGAKESFTRGYRRGQSRKAKLREEMGKAEAQQEAGKPPVVPNELPPAAAEVAVPEAPAPRPVVPAPPPPVVPPIVPPVVPPTPAVEEAVAPPVQPKATTFDQQMADYGRRLSEIAKSHDVDNLEAIVGEMEDFRNKGGARTDQQIKVLNSAIAKSWDTLQSVRRAEQQNAPVPQEVAPEMQTIDPAKMEVAEPKPAVPKAKEPWAMTRDQFFSQPHNPRDARFHGDQFHKDAIREAIGMGRPVPPEVLDEYPDLKPPAQAETTGKKEVVEEPAVEVAAPQKAEAPKLEAPAPKAEAKQAVETLPATEIPKLPAPVKKLLLESDLEKGTLPHNYTRTAKFVDNLARLEKEGLTKGDNSVELTDKGKAVIAALNKQTATLKAGVPISQYKPGNGKLQTPEGSRFTGGDAGWTHNKVHGQEVYTNGQFALIGEAPGPLSASKTQPDIEQVWDADYLKDDSPSVQPVAYAKNEGQPRGVPDSLVWFSDSEAMDAKYYDHALSRYPNATFRHGDEGTGFLVFDGEKRVGIIMPVRKVEAPENVAAMLGPTKPEEPDSESLDVEGDTGGTVAFKPKGHPSTWPKQRAKADFEARRKKAAARQAKKKPAAPPVDVSTPEAVHKAVGVGNRIRSADGKISLAPGPDNSIEVKASNKKVLEFLADNQTGLGLRMEREPNGTYRYYLDANEEAAGKISRLMEAHPLSGEASEASGGMEAYAPTVAAPERTGAPTMAVSREGQPVVEPIRRREMMERLNKDFEKVAIRIGGLVKRGAAAEYHIISEAIRAKKANDLPSLMHEVGHHVHKLLWGRVGKNLHSAALKPFADELKPLDYNPSKGRIFEGFAEFVREYITAPESARKAAPKFYEFFERTLTERTDLADTLLGLRSDYSRWTGQDPIDRIMGGIAIARPPDQRSWLHVAEDKWDDAYARWVSANDPFLQAANAMLQGKDIPIEKHPYFLAQSMSGSAGRAQQYLDTGTYDPITYEHTGDGLKQVAEKIRDIPISDRIKSKMLARIKADKVHFSNFDDKIWAFRAYTVAARVLEKTGEQKIETGFDLEDARATVEELESPEMIEAAQAFYDYQDRVFDYPVRLGIMSAADKAKVNELNKKYVRFGRVIEEEPGRTPGDRPGGGNPIRKMKGDTRDIWDPLEGAIYNTHAIIKWADRQRALNSLIDLADQSDASGWMVDKYRPKAKAFSFNLKEVKKEIEEALGQKIEEDDLDIFTTLFRAGTQAPPGKNVVAVLRNGKHDFYQLNEFLYRALHPKSEYDNSLAQFLLKWFGPPTRLLRMGAVGLNPEFTGITNPTRDLITAHMQSEYQGGDPVKLAGYLRDGNVGEAARELFGATLFPRIFYTLQGLKEAGQSQLHARLPGKVSASDLVEEWRAAGGEHSAYYAMDQDHLVDSLKDLLASAPGFFAHHPIAVIRMVGELTENMTRLGEYGLARRRGATPMEAVMKGSRPVTVDFSRAGLLGRVVNQIAAFYNAKVQGTDQFVRAHGRRTLPRSMFRGLMQITIPALLLQLLNQDDPEYEELPQWQKDWYFMIPTKYFGNDWLYDKTPFIPLPKPFLWGLIYGTIPERIFQSVVKKDPEAFDNVLPMILKEAIPNPLGITAVMPLIEMWAKKSFFTLENTEPGYVSGLSEKYRAKGYTTQPAREMSKWLYDTGIGKTIQEQTGIALTPINIDNFIFGLTGSVGMHITRIGNIIDPDAPAATSKDIPLIRALAVRSPNSQSDSITKFYDRYEDLAQRAKDAREALKKPEGPTKGAPELAASEESELKRLRFFHGKISSHWKHDREIRDDTKLTPDQKRQRIDTNTMEMINLAREAIGRRPYGRPTRKP